MRKVYAVVSTCTDSSERTELAGGFSEACTKAEQASAQVWVRVATIWHRGQPLRDYRDGAFARDYDGATS